MGAPTNLETVDELLLEGSKQLSAGAERDALATFQRGIERFPKDWRFPCNAATVLHGLGATPEAIRLLNAALKLGPDQPFLHLKLGSWLLEVGQGEAAVPLFERAVILSGSDTKSLLQLAIAYMETKQVDAALGTVERAIDDSPEHADARALLGLILASLGKREESTAALEQALAIDPACPQAAYHLARRGVDIDPVPLEERLRLGGVDPTERGKLCFALGNQNDRLGRHGLAFSYYQRANALVRRSWDPDCHSGVIQGLIETCDREFFASRADPGFSDRAPIFIVGLPRTGSTLLEQILGEHPGIHAIGEHSGGIPRIARTLASTATGVRPYPHGLADLDPAARAALAQRYEQSIDAEPKVRERIARGEVRTLDKLLANHQALGLIALLFPGAKILNCRRDPRDCGLSAFFLEFQRRELPWTYDLEDIARYFRDYERLDRHWKEHLPLETLDVRYEQLVSKPEEWSRRICEFVGLEWAEECMDYAGTDRPVFTASAMQVREKPHQRAVERWRPYAEHLGPLQEIAREWGYA